MWPKSISELARILNAPEAPLKNPRDLIQSLTTDSRKVAPGEMFVAIRGEKHDGHDFIEGALQQGARIALVESQWLQTHTAWADRCLAVQDTTQALRTLAMAFRAEMRFPIFAVGGSNGKTTTKEMLACLLAALNAPVTRTHKSENGFLGLAMTLTQKTHRIDSPPATLVAEIGIDAVGAMAEHLKIAQPDIALLTALGPEHLAGLGSWDVAVEEELVLFRAAPKTCRRVWQCAEPRLRDVLTEIRTGDVLVCASEQFHQLPDAVQKLAQNKDISVLQFEIQESKATRSVIQASWTPGAKDEKSSPWKEQFEVPLPGIHNAQNFALALASAAITCKEIRAMSSAWSHFVPPEMRSRIVKLNGGITLYDDCYNASPASMEAAFEALLSDEWRTQHKILVLGDMLDLGEESKSWHLRLVDKLLKFENSDLCLFGSAMYDVYNEIKSKHSATLRSSNIQLRHAGSDTNPASFLGELENTMAGSVILVKGSRGMDLGRFVKSCEAWSVTQG